MRIDIKGTIVSDSDKWVYDFFGIPASCPADVIKALDQADGNPVDVDINSGGGDLFAGNEIYAALQRYGGEIRVHVVGLAASAASVIACAGESDITPGGMLMIHNVSSYADGDYHAMDKSSDTLKTANRAVCAVYRSKTGMTEQQLLDAMDTETWMTADEAVSKGFIDRVAERADLKLTAASFCAPMLSRKAIDMAKKQARLSSAQKAAARMKLLKLSEVKNYD